MISIDTALTWVSWAFAFGAIVGIAATAALVVAVYWGELPRSSKRKRVGGLP